MRKHSGDLASERLSLHLAEGLNEASEMITVCDLRYRHFKSISLCSTLEWMRRGCELKGD